MKKIILSFILIFGLFFNIKIFAETGVIDSLYIKKSYITELNLLKTKLKETKYNKYILKFDKIISKLSDEKLYKLIVRLEQINLNNKKYSKYTDIINYLKVKVGFELFSKGFNKSNNIDFSNIDIKFINFKENYQVGEPILGRIEVNNVPKGFIAFKYIEGYFFYKNNTDGFIDVAEKNGFSGNINYFKEEGEKTYYVLIYKCTDLGYTCDVIKSGKYRDTFIFYNKNIKPYYYKAITFNVSNNDKNFFYKDGIRFSVNDKIIDGYVVKKDNNLFFIYNNGLPHKLIKIVGININHYKIFKPQNIFTPKFVYDGVNIYYLKYDTLVKKTVNLDYDSLEVYEDGVDTILKDINGEYKWRDIIDNNTFIKFKYSNN